MLRHAPRPSRLRRAFWKLRSRTPGFHVVVGGLMLMALGFHALTFRPEVWWGDAYQYLLHAENLLSGRAYADTGVLPGPDGLGPQADPVGYPLVLAPLVALFGASPVGLALTSSLFLIGASWLTATLARGWLPDPFAAAIAVLVAFQPGLMAASRQPLADPLFLVLVVLCLLAAERASYQTERWRRRALVAGAALALAVATRPLGLVLAPALLIPGLVRSRRLERPAIVSLAVGAALWAVLVVVDRATAPGVAGLEALGVGPRPLSELPGRLVGYVRGSYPLWYVPGSDLAKNVLFAIAMFPAGVGFAHRVRRRLGPAEAFAALYVIALVVWTEPSTRALFPLYPIYLLYLVVGVWRLGRDTQARQWATSAALAAAVAFSYGGRYLGWAVSPPSAVVDADDEAVYRHLRTATPADAVVLTTGDPRPAVYYARRAVARGPSEVGDWAAFADRTGASYALVRDDSELAAALLDDPRHEVVLRRGSQALVHICPGPCAGPE